MKIVEALALQEVNNMNIFNWFTKKKKTCIDFSAGFNLTEMPIVTFKQGNIKLNFLLDTGSNNSLINKSVVKKIKHNPLETNTKVFGLDGNYNEVGLTVISIFYNNIEYTNEFMISDLDKPFSNIKKESGVTIHGILGNNFFTKNKSILDFEELKAYFK